MRNMTKSAAFTPTSPPVTRREALSVFAGLIGAAAVTPIRAAEKPPKKGERGSKEAKGYQLCLSQCLYDCTTPKAGLAKERSQCRTECKDECAVKEIVREQVWWRQVHEEALSTCIFTMRGAQKYLMFTRYASLILRYGCTH